MNPCPCGNAGEPTRQCTCGAAEILKYRARLSGPLADRIDMHVTLGAVPPRAMQSAHTGEASSVIRARVERCRGRQRDRYRKLTSVSCNAHAAGRWLLAHGDIAPDARELLASAMESLNLSARGFHRVLRVARTIADLGDSRSVDAIHVAEAIRYRPRTVDSHAAAGVTAPTSVTFGGTTS
jgi:magnesium chelatase family protein